jgi:hypothetical protein
MKIHPEDDFLAFHDRKYSNDHAYLITNTDTIYATDTGRTWNLAKASTPPNTFRAQVIHFHSNTDNLMSYGWAGGHGSINPFVNGLLSTKAIAMQAPKE